MRKIKIQLAFLLTLAFTGALTTDAQSKREAPASNVGIAFDGRKFIGEWEFNSEPGYKQYFRVNEVQPRRFKFEPGLEWQGKISWDGLMVRRSDAIYLKPFEGKLRGTFVSPNFRATHGHDITYTITLTPQANGQLLYSVTSQLAPERYYATRIGGSPPTIGSQENQPSQTSADTHVVTGIVIDILHPASGSQIKLDSDGKCYQFGLGTDYRSNRLSRSRVIAWNRVVNTLQNGDRVSLEYSEPLQSYDCEYGNALTVKKLINRPSAQQANAWNEFWTAFRAAVRRRDRAALKEMMVIDFEWSFGGYPEGDRRDTFFTNVMDKRTWLILDRVLAQGTMPYDEHDPTRPNLIARIAPPHEPTYAWRAVFELGADGRWRWSAFISGD